MAFADDLARHAEQVRARMQHCTGEQAAKQALVVPLLQLLGYDVFDPREVVPEYRSDFAIKKQGQFEKVDYALVVNGAPAVFIECKPVGAALEDHGGQLARYFNATPTVRVAIITDGVQLRAFTDLRQPNVMDERPWLSVDLLALKPAEVDALRRFRKGDFASEEIVALAEEMVFYSAMVDFLSKQLREPSESFVRFVAGEIQAAGRVTSRIVERLTPVLRKAIQSAIVEHVARSFDARPAETAAPPPVEPTAPAPVAAATTPIASTRDGVVTTEDELAVFQAIEAWVHEILPGAPVIFRDSKTYFAIHQENTRKWFLRGFFDRKPGWIALRHVSPDEARRLAPGLEASDAGFEGGCRLVLPTVSDVSKARAAVIMAYQREAARKTEEGPVEPAEA